MSIAHPRSEDFEERLSVITAVSRPELLPVVGSSVPACAEWILVTDGKLPIPEGLRPHTLIEGPRTAQWGDVQKSIGLHAATRPYLYFLDDDNLMLPSLGQLVIPYLERHALAGALFAILVHAYDQTHIWPAPSKIRAGHVDTAMFLGRREATLQLSFERPVPARGWPNLQGKRWGDYVFLRAFENRFGLARLPAVYGFHNALPLLQELEPQFFQSLGDELRRPTAVEQLLNSYLIRADVPSWW